ncbi:MAG: hypothetical protein M3337_05160, partial [Actinomycetota bacterium]|nr:hypothetical protein [Actinomycetota bacterium]
MGALLVGLTLIAAACGDDDDDPETTSGDEPTVTEAPSTDAPSTDAPTTDAPSTDAPSTDAPTTDGETTTPTGAETTPTDDGTAPPASGFGSCAGEVEVVEVEGETVGSAPPTIPPEEGGESGALAGMKGTTPLVDLPEDFTSRLSTCWTDLGNATLEDFNYGAESYDAVITIALAAEIAETDGSALANEIVGVTRDGEECTDYAGCLELVQAGTDIDYNGVSGPGEFNGNGEPLVASYGLLQFGEDNQLDPELTEFITAEA